VTIERPRAQKEENMEKCHICLRSLSPEEAGEAVGTLEVDPPGIDHNHEISYYSVLRQPNADSNG
jgi:hypothetical protein